jgi:hypothetical protein
MATRKKASHIPDELRQRYAALTEPTWDLHSELGLKPWHDQLKPGFPTLEEAIAEVEQELADRHCRKGAPAL